MKAGKYWVGDLCYLVPPNEWEQVVAFLGDGKTPREGEFDLNGHRGAIFSTYHGDGVYYDQFGNSYGVDSGTVGIFPAEVFDSQSKELGTIHDFPEDFIPRSVDGNMEFGHLRIRTRAAACPKFFVRVKVLGVGERVFPLDVVDECYSQGHDTFPGVRVADPDAFEEFTRSPGSAECVDYHYSEGLCTNGVYEDYETEEEIFHWQIEDGEGNRLQFEDIEGPIFAHYLIVKKD
jgi:hypothetical protein